MQKVELLAQRTQLLGSKRKPGGLPAGQIATAFVDPKDFYESGVTREQIDCSRQ